MFKLFEAETAQLVWNQIWKSVDEDPHPTQDSRAGMTKEILHAAISIGNPRERWIARHPPINPAFAIAELVWIISGRNDSKFLNYFNSQLPKYSGGGDFYHGAYGHRLRKHLGLDQIERAFSVLRRNSDSRQVVLQIWDGRIDLPNPDGTPKDSDIPCNIVSFLKIRGGALEWTQVMRSNDVFRGLPYNILQFTSLQEILAGWLEVKVGSYNHVSDSLHAYLPDVKIASDRLDHVPNADSLAISKEQSELLFRSFADRMERVIDERVLGPELLDLLNWPEATAAFMNLLVVVIAEGLRRRSRLDLAAQVMGSCTNPALSNAWLRWETRLNASAANRGP